MRSQSRSCSVGLGLGLSLGHTSGARGGRRSQGPGTGTVSLRKAVVRKRRLAPDFVVVVCCQL